MKKLQPTGNRIDWINHETDNSEDDGIILDYEKNVAVWLKMDDVVKLKGTGGKLIGKEMYVYDGTEKYYEYDVTSDVIDTLLNEFNENRIDEEDSQ